MDTMAFFIADGYIADGYKEDGHDAFFLLVVVVDGYMADRYDEREELSFCKFMLDVRRRATGVASKKKLRGRLRSGGV